MKRLMLMRHAKSSWDNEGQSDYDRPLNGRGNKEAEIVGKQLKELKVLPDLIVSSSAARAKETTKRFLDGLGHDIKVQYEDGLYAASPERILEEVRLLPDSGDTVMIVGHNPGMTDLVTALTGEYLPEGMKTANIACIALTFTPLGIVEAGGHSEVAASAGHRNTERHTEHWKDAASGKLEWLLTPDKEHK